MMKGYSDFLFHFTPKYEYLISIVKNGFRMSPCREKIAGLPEEIYNIEHIIPMVCFTDIRLHQILEHSSKYGKFGIGVSKNWAIENGAQPMIYMNEKTGFSKAMTQYFSKIKEGYLDRDKTNHSKEEMFYFNLTLLSKHMDFYEEREWRMLPMWVKEESLKEKVIDGFKNYYVEIKDSNDIVLIVLPSEMVNRLKEDLNMIFKENKYDTNYNFPIIPLEYIHKL